MSHQPVMMAYDAASFAPDGRRLWYSSDFDTIDRLDTSGPNGMPMFHHGGPYDAVLPSRNWDPKTSPMAALSGSLAEALRATPQEYIADCLQQGVPLQGTATIPSGQLDYEGNRMDYEEGSNLVRDSDSIAVSYQQYRQWDCGSVKQRRRDVQGKEPVHHYPAERERDVKGKGRAQEGFEEIEMQSMLPGRRGAQKPLRAHRNARDSRQTSSSSGGGRAYMYDDGPWNSQRRKANSRRAE
ncbi:hypothetical protein BBK36DRAFT_1156990 [Trichoderma citrinoviride]|uniref:Uncharacterized protein n=1 Tax=Trichoderma citrinoviride TaxID=58853 RepID=A0A2T4BHE4_9HYPO|nr:hypothetical protein BBK36DRAFT_1156990 [Trichoderma citrinoviride]PTB68740.1 hypothetical protein BBK36DRAFT_1156990 [Trichoderma citrinoviride]